MKVKQILAIFIVMLLVVIALPSVASAQTEQYWYLNDTTSTAGRVMDKGNPTDASPNEAEDYVTIAATAGSSVVWTADEASQGCTFPADTWDGTIRFTTAPPSGTDTIVLDVGYSTNLSAGNFTSNGTTQSLSPAGETVFSIAIGASQFTVASGDYLAFKVTNNTGGTITVDTGGNGQSNLTSPATDPGYPIPELPTVVLFATGLVCLAGYFGFKRWKRGYIKAQ